MLVNQLEKVLSVSRGTRNNIAITMHNCIQGMLLKDSFSHHASFKCFSRYTKLSIIYWHKWETNFVRENLLTTHVESSSLLII